MPRKPSGVEMPPAQIVKRKSVERSEKLLKKGEPAIIV
jgi:hypothetical protein